MKQYLILLFALLSFIGTYAQQGEIIYTDFEPDLTLTQGVNSFDSIVLDVDGDGSYDIKFGLYNEGHGFEMPYFKALNSWHICRTNNIDTLNSTELSWILVDGAGPWNGRYYGLRKTVDEDFYYGWIYLYDGVLKTGKNTKALGTLFIDRMAYCTIPNYPLCCGQTSFTGLVENDESSAFTIVSPNPTTGFVTITGKDLKQVEVFNTLGQHVATAKGEGERMTVDISPLPAGIYFVNITDSEGRKCVRKVVKE